MAIAQLTKKDVNSILKALPSMLRVPARRFWVDYDEEADVMYISSVDLSKPPRAGCGRMGSSSALVAKRS